MAWTKAITDDELEFIRASYGRMTVATIAERLGRSERSVYRHAARMGLREEADSRARECHAQAFGGKAPGTHVERLEELSELLRAALLECDSRTLPKVASEYRETLESIERAKSASAEEGGGDELGSLLGIIKLREP